jgi:hypothetical protein
MYSHASRPNSPSSRSLIRVSRKLAPCVKPWTNGECKRTPEWMQDPRKRLHKPRFDLMSQTAAERGGKEMDMHCAQYPFSFTGNKQSGVLNRSINKETKPNFGHVLMQKNQACSLWIS